MSKYLFIRRLFYYMELCKKPNKLAVSKKSENDYPNVESSQPKKNENED